MPKLSMKELSERLDKVERRQALIIDCLNDIGTHIDRAAVAFSKQDTAVAYAEIDKVHDVIENAVKACAEVLNTVYGDDGE